MPDPTRDSLITQGQVDYYLAQIKAFIGQGLGELLPDYSGNGASEDFLDELALDAAIQVLQNAKQRKISFNNSARSIQILSVAAAPAPHAGDWSRLHTSDMLGRVDSCGNLTSYLTADVNEITVSGSSGYNGTHTVKAVGAYYVDIEVAYTSTSTGLISFSAELRNPSTIQFGDGLLQTNIDANTIRVSATQPNENIVVTPDTNIFVFYDGSNSFLEEIPAIQAAFNGPLKTALVDYYGSEANYNAHVFYVRGGQGNPNVPDRNPDALTEAWISWMRGVTSAYDTENPGAPSLSSGYKVGGEAVVESYGTQNIVTTALGPKCILLIMTDEANTVYYNYGDPNANPVTERTLTPWYKGFGAHISAYARLDIDRLKAFIDPCVGNFDYYRATVLHFECGVRKAALQSVTLAHRNFIQSVQLGELFEYTIPPNRMISFQYNVRRRSQVPNSLWNMGEATTYYYGVIKKALKNMGVVI